jgi:hypothetical protein
MALLPRLLCFLPRKRSPAAGCGVAPEKDPAADQPTLPSVAFRWTGSNPTCPSSSPSPDHHTLCAPLAGSPPGLCRSLQPRQQPRRRARDVWPAAASPPDCRTCRADGTGARFSSLYLKIEPKLSPILSASHITESG